MDLKHLERFIEWLQNDLTHFECLVIEGSAVTKDLWQQEFSDYDLNVVVRQDPENESKAIYKFIMNNKLGDNHLLGVINYDNFISGDSLTDLSYKYRSKVIAGNDLIKAKQRPSRNIIYKQGVDGLEHLITIFNRRKLNLAHWSDDYSRKKNYDVFKQFFVMTAAWAIRKNGELSRNQAGSL